MRVDNVIRGLKTLIRDRIPKRASRGLERRDNLFAAPLRYASDDMSRTRLAQDLVTQRGVEVHIATGITLYGNKCKINIRIGIDQGNSPKRTAAACLGDQRIIARSGI